MPWGPYDGNGWSTNWEWNSWDVVTGPIKTGGRYNDGGWPSAVKDRTQAIANLRAPYPGEVGQRNAFRGERYFSMSNGLTKTLQVYRDQQLKFAWEVVNSTNAVTFDPVTATSDPFGSAATTACFRQQTTPV